MKNFTLACHFWSRSVGLSAKNVDLIENAVGHFGLGQQRQGFHALMADQRDDVGINAETGSCLGNIVSNDHVQMLFIQLLLGVFQKMLRFGNPALPQRLHAAFSVHRQPSQRRDFPPTSAQRAGRPVF